MRAGYEVEGLKTGMCLYVVVLPEVVLPKSQSSGVAVLPLCTTTAPREVMPVRASLSMDAMQEGMTTMVLLV